MADHIVHISAKSTAVRRALASLPQEATGGGWLASSMMEHVGAAALGLIRAAFITKSRGGTDAAGDRWAPLSPTTIMMRARRTRTQRSRSPRPSQALTKRQEARWWDLYRQGLAMFQGNKGRAAKRAWGILKREGAVTLMQLYGNRSVDILRDTGLLLDSLSPGSTSPDQVLRVMAGEVVVGTNRPHAGSHHRGVPGRIPQRRLWPEPSRWPSAWWDDITDQAIEGLLAMAEQLARGSR